MFGLPTMYAVCFVMWLFHGIVLDILLIGLLPFLSADRSDAQRADKFIWALGGYEGYPKVPNLGPTHRRFITENAAYALLRASPAIFITNVPIITTCVISYLIEAVTVSWEITCWNCPADGMVAVTLMGVFASISTYTVSTNPEGYIADVPENLVVVMKAATAGCWLCWVISAGSLATKKKSA